MKFLIFDTETTGFSAKNRLVQLAWQLYDENTLINQGNFIVKPYKFTIPRNVAQIHGITTEFAEMFGQPLPQVLRIFLRDLEQADYIVGHNIDYDVRVLSGEFGRLRMPSPVQTLPRICTMRESRDYLKLPFNGTRAKYKNPKLGELYRFLFRQDMKNAHNAMGDVEATAQCFFELRRRGIIEV